MRAADFQLQPDHITEAVTAYGHTLLTIELRQMTWQADIVGVAGQHYGVIRTG
jgi:hypothetical protein